MSVFLPFGRRGRGGGGGKGGGVCCVFAVWAGGVFLFIFFDVWAGACCFFFAVWAGDRSSLTYRSAWLVFKRPNNKKDQTAKKKKRKRVP